MTDHILNGDNIIKVDVACDVGMVRQNNEDMILVGGEFVRDSSLRQIYELSSQARFAAIVADGMGGHNGGEVASEFVLHQLDDYLMDLPAELSESELSDALRYWAKNTHRLLIEQSHERPECEGMGTTLCGLLFYEKMVFAGNRGDSGL